MSNRNTRPKHNLSRTTPARTPANHASKSLGIDPNVLIDEYADERVGYHVGQIGRSYRLTEDERDDLRQDFFKAICAAARRYDSSRSRPQTFVCRVVERAAAYFKRRIRNERRCMARSPLLLSQLQRENRGFSPLAPRTCEPSSHDLVLDLRYSFTKLNRRQQQTAEALKNQTVAEIAAERSAHRSTVYRDIGSMRATLAELGLTPGR